MIKNQNGFVTAEFMFAIVIATCMTFLTFALTFTLSTVEVVQYMVFSSSRAHAAANFDINAQQEAAKSKYTSLISSPTLAPLFSNGWFEAPVSKLEIRSGAGNNFNQDYEIFRDSGQGVRVTFRANLLEMKLPLVGNVTSPTGTGFETRINAILLREISQKECFDYMEARVPALVDLFPGLAKSADVPKSIWEDNGC